MRIVLPFLLLSAVSGLACSRAPRAERRSGVAPGSATALGPRVELAPRVEPAQGVAAPLPVVDGQTLLAKIRASGQRGVVVNVWASWCDSCRHELPMLARVAPELAALGVPIWLVSVDEPEAFPAAQALLDSLHVELPRFGAAPPLSAFKTALNPRWPGMIPVSFLFDAAGKLRYFWAGEVYEKELLPIVVGFAAGKPIDGVSDFGLAPGATQGHD